MRERQPFEPRDTRQVDAPVGGVDDARHADHGAVDQVLRQPGRRYERVAEGDDRLQRAGCVGAFELDVLPGPDGAAQVGDGAAQEAAAEVEPEHERRLRHRLEEDRAVARPAGVGRSLADEPCLEQRLQRERDGGLRDARPARDLGSGDGRAVADRLQHGPLVEVLEQGRDRAAGAGAARHVSQQP